MQKSHRRIEQIFCTVYFSQPFTMAVLTGVIMKNTTFLARKLDLKDRKPNCPPTGTLPSPRSVSVWKFTNNSTSLSSKGRLNLFTRWLLTDNTPRLHWDVTTGRRSLVLKPLCRRDVTRKGLMQMMIKGLPPKPELVLLATMNGTALHAIQGLDLVQEAHLMTQTPVETRKIGIQIIEKDTSKSWVTS